MLDISLGQTLRLLREVAGISLDVTTQVMSDFIDCSNFSGLSNASKNNSRSLSTQPSYHLQYVKAQLKAIEINLKLPSEELLHVLAELYECDIYDYIELLCKHAEAKAQSPGYCPWHSTKEFLFLGIFRPKKGRAFYYTYSADKPKTKKCRLVRQRQNKLIHKPAYQKWQVVSLTPSMYQQALTMAIGYHNDDLDSYINIALGLNFENFDKLEHSSYKLIADWLQLKLPHILGCFETEQSQDKVLGEFFSKEILTQHTNQILDRLTKGHLAEFPVLMIIKEILSMAPLRKNKAVANKVMGTVLSRLPNSLVRSAYKPFINKDVNDHRFGIPDSSCLTNRKGLETDKKLLARELKARNTKVPAQAEPNNEEFEKVFRDFVRNISWSELEDDEDAFYGEHVEKTPCKIQEDMLSNDETGLIYEPNVNQLENEFGDNSSDDSSEHESEDKPEKTQQSHVAPSKSVTKNESIKNESPVFLGDKGLDKLAHIQANENQKVISNEQIYVIVRPFGFSHEVDVNVNVVVIPAKGKLL